MKNDLILDNLKMVTLCKATQNRVGQITYEETSALFDFATDQEKRLLRKAIQNTTSKTYHAEIGEIVMMIIYRLFEWRVKNENN